jgi:hypothetical protein
MNDLDKCARESCRCSVSRVRLEQHARYCSDPCAVEPDTGYCPCGHEECSHTHLHHESLESVISIGPDDAGLPASP